MASNDNGGVVLVVLGLFAAFMIILYNGQQQRQEIIDSLKSDISFAFDEIKDEADKLANEIQSGCDWQYSISSNVGDYCPSQSNDYNALSDYNWDVSSYETDSIYDIVDEANDAYNHLLDEMDGALAAYEQQCDYIGEYLSEDLGDRCRGYINGYELSRDPINVSNYSTN